MIKTVAPDALATPPRCPLRTRGGVIAWRISSRIPGAVPGVRLTGRDLEALRAVIASTIDDACDLMPRQIQTSREKREEKKAVAIVTVKSSPPQ